MSQNKLEYVNTALTWIRYYENAIQYARTYAERDYFRTCKEGWEKRLAAELA